MIQLDYIIYQKVIQIDKHKVSYIPNKLLTKYFNPNNNPKQNFSTSTNVVQKHIMILNNYQFNQFNHNVLQ